LRCGFFFLFNGSEGGLLSRAVSRDSSIATVVEESEPCIVSCSGCRVRDFFEEVGEGVVASSGGERFEGTVTFASGIIPTKIDIG
jgi:hypothetical protein